VIVNLVVGETLRQNDKIGQNKAEDYLS